MAYKAGDTVTEDIPINVGKLLEIAGIGEAVAGSANAMIAAAKKIILSVAGTTIATGGNPIVLGAMLSTIAKGVVDYIIGKKISKVGKVTVRLYYKLTARTVHKQNQVHHILQWKCTKFKIL